MRFEKAMFVAAVATSLLVLMATSAHAHTSFELSMPADGEVVDPPIEQITIVYTGEAEPTGGGFEVFDSSGLVRTPTTMETADGRTWVLNFDPPLNPGAVGVRWNVKAPDAHPIDGAFSFTVATPAAPAEVSTPVSTAPVSSLPSPAGNEATDDGDDTNAAAPALDEFLDGNDGGGRDTASRYATIGRMLSITGALLGLGALAFAWLVLRGERADIRHVMFWVRRAGVLTVAGAAVEFVAQVAIEGGGTLWALTDITAFGRAMFGDFGLAVALRALGGVALTAGARFTIEHAAVVPDPVVAVRDLIGIGAEYAPESEIVAAPQLRPDPLVNPEDAAWKPAPDALVPIVGGVAIVASFLFDGHTVTEGPRLLTAVLTVVHVVAGAIWAGGVAMLAAVAWQRRSRGRPPRAAQMALRFSIVATLALVAVGVAGFALTVIVLDSIPDLFATPWGRLVLAKIALVGVAAGAGAYNHTMLIPKLHAHGDRHGLPAHFRRVITIEAGLVLGVGLLTAFLVGAAA